ncbi:MAG: hypothetical protein ACKPGL_08555 [Dolichospermum sp.]
MACALTETAATAASSDGTAAAAVPALALVPAGGAGGSGGGRSFRIGSEHHGYVYTETPMTMTDPWQNSPIYRYNRDMQRHNRTLFFYKSGSTSKHWVAVSTPTNIDDPIHDGQPIFRTIDEQINPTITGTYRWQQCDPVSSVKHLAVGHAV